MAGRANQAPYPHSLCIGQRSRRHIAAKLWWVNVKEIEHVCVACGARGNPAWRRLSSAGEGGARGRGGGSSWYWHRNSCAVCQRDICHRCTAGNEMTNGNSLTFCEQRHLMQPHCSTCGRGGKDQHGVDILEGSQASRGRGVSLWPCATDACPLLLCIRCGIKDAGCWAHWQRGQQTVPVQQQGMRQQVAIAYHAAAGAHTDAYGNQ